METILLVDDVVILADLCTEGLKREGFEVYCAYSGEECLELLKSVCPDVILLDIMMPGMDGWQTLKQIRSDPETEEIPVLVVTAKALTTRDLLEFGDLIDGFLVKPFKIKELSDIVRQFFKDRRVLSDIISEAEISGGGEEVVHEFAKLARRIFVQRKLIEELKSRYYSLFDVEADADANGIPRVMQQLESKFRKDEKRFSELVSMLGVSENYPDIFE
ncbi:MAG: response regulator [Methanogenium sp.]|nr:response regulator [Methanogenium sp.]